MKSKKVLVYWYKCPEWKKNSLPRLDCLRVVPETLFWRAYLKDVYHETIELTEAIK